jgi:Na+-driven multidrug efflux pump
MRIPDRCRFGCAVATWAMMGVIWEIFETMTEGLGEAASVRVSLYLTEGFPKEARLLSHKVVFLTFLLVLAVISLFLMVGPNLSALLTTDVTIQHLFLDAVGVMGLANVTMTLAQVYWSLAGAQGKFGFASGTILMCRWIVMLPIASICIFGYDLDVVAVAGAVAIGYAVATCALAYTVFTCDWVQLAYFLREEEDIEAVDEGYHGTGVMIVDEGDDESSSDDEDSSEESNADDVPCETT